MNSIRNALSKGALLTSCAALAALPAHAEWTHQLIDPPDNNFESQSGAGWSTSIEETEDTARAQAHAVGGVLFSTTADAQAFELTIRRHIWRPEPDYPTGLFS